MAANVLQTSAARCAKRSGSIKATSSSYPFATSRTTRATSFSSTPPTRPAPSRPTESCPKTQRSTRPTPLARARTVRPTSSSATPTTPTPTTRAPRRMSTLTISNPSCYLCLGYVVRARSPHWPKSPSSSGACFDSARRLSFHRTGTLSSLSDPFERHHGF